MFKISTGAPVSRDPQFITSSGSMLFVIAPNLVRIARIQLGTFKRLGLSCGEGATRNGGTFRVLNSELTLARIPAIVSVVQGGADYMGCC